MRLHTEFIRLPFVLDSSRLVEEIAQFEEGLWRPHPQGYAGNSALSLIAVGGDAANDEVKGPMRPTPSLGRCPYLRQVLSTFGSPLGRTRLMRIDGNSEATPHVDTNYYWMHRVRIHVPIVTDSAVRFLCGEKSLHMAAGESWIFDTWKLHNVINPNPTRRIHLVADTKPSPHLLSLISTPAEPRVVVYEPDAEVDLALESQNFPVVMSPHEQSSLVSLLDLEGSSDARTLASAIDRFLDDWRELWHRFDERRDGWPQYRALLDRFNESLERFALVRTTNGLEAIEIVRQMLVRPALNPDLAEPRRAPAIHPRRMMERPVFIVSSPRSGSTLLFETLAQSPTVFTPGGESHAIIEGLDALHPAHHGWDSNRLIAGDASTAVASVLETRFMAALHDRDGRAKLTPHLRMLEKTPKNALRIPFIRAVFPDALFIYLYRDPRATISSMLDAWRSGRFVTYPALPGWEGPPWSLLLTPGWRELNGRPLPDIVAHQWRVTTETLLDDLEQLPAGSWCVASYDALTTHPQQEIERLCAFVGIDWDRKLTTPLPLSRHTLSAPDPEKWRRNGAEIESIFAQVATSAERAREIFSHPPAERMRFAMSRERPEEAGPSVESQPAFRSVHTSSFAEILTAIRSSLIVSTYQSGRVVLLRAERGKMNTHLVAFPSPMGLAVGRRSLAIGTSRQVWDYCNSAALVAKLNESSASESARTYDACFAPRTMHYTGDIRIHEVAFDVEDELWLVNTRFSALCTLDREHSFVPRWRPPFITRLAAEDRCHLNGLCMIDGRPRFVTALGDTNTPGGWREKKTDGGVLLDINSGQRVVRGLSMPHSPRWYAGRLWVLESGKGTLAAIDPVGRRIDTVAQLPGFTRGLAFAGPYAFIGLSQVRETVFDGIPLSKRLALEERVCGVWVVDIRSGNIAAFLKFEDAVQEIFDVQVLHGVQCPELLDGQSDIVGAAFTVPDEALADVHSP